MNMNFDQSDKDIIKLFEETKEEFLLTKTEKADLKTSLETSVTKPDNKRYNIWSYQLNFKGVIMPLIPLIIALVIAIGTGTIVSADNANPGDVLYGLDQFMENFQEKMPMSQSRKAKFFARLSEERAIEVQELQDVDIEELDEEAQTRWERHQEDAIGRLAASIEKVESVQDKFQEKIDSIDSEDQKEVFQKVIDHLDEVKARRETKLNEIEDGEAPGLRGFPIRQHIKDWKNMSKEEMAEIKEQIKEDFGEIMDDFKSRMKDFNRGNKTDADGDDEDEEDDDNDDEDEDDEETDTNNNTI